MDDAGRSFSWLFTDEQLRRTPSASLGISHGQELVFRQKQAMLMQALGQKSGLTQLAINTSVVFMHRFYMFRSVKYFPRIHVAIGFIFAAGKVEESARKLEHLIRTTIDILRHNKNGEFLDKRDKLTYEMDCEWREKIEALCQNNCNVESAAYLEMRRTVLECEAEIYAVIGFHLQIVHPHNFVIRMCGQLGSDNIKDISQYAYNLATASSQLTLLCLKYKPELIATVCLNIAAKAHSVKFMCMKDAAVQWYQVYDPTMDIKEIESVSEEFLSLIKSCQLLPSWMTSLARAPRSNPRSMPASVKGVAPSTPSSSSHHNRGHQANPPSSSQGRELAKAPPPTTTSSSASSSHLEKQQGIQPNSMAPVTGDGVPSNGSHHRLVEGSAGSKTNLVPSASGMSGSGAPLARSQSSSHLSSSQHHSQAQHGSPAGMASQPPSAPPQSLMAATAGSRSQSANAMSRHSSSSSSLPPGSRPSHPSSSSTSHPLPPSSRSRFDPNNRHEAAAHRLDAPDANRRSSGRPMPPPHKDQTRGGHHSTRLDHSSSQSLLESSTTRTHTPPLPASSNKPASSPITKQPSPPSHQTSDSSAFAMQNALERNAGMLEGDLSQLQDSMTPPLRGSVSSSKLSLSTYRERVRTRPAPPPASESLMEDSGFDNISNTDDSGSQIIFKETPAAIPSPAVVPSSSAATAAGLKPSMSAPDLASFNAAKDSPTNPRIKIKVKRDPSSGERHSVKYESGLKIKIKPPRMDPAAEVGEPGPSASRSSTPMEEGEVVDSPSSVSSGERKLEGSLKIRLPVPRSGESSSYSRAGGEQVNGYGEHHSSHHHSHHHHRSHHSHKSKKHSSSKHSSSRHERSSSKRPPSSLAYEHDERPSKSSRLNYPLSQTTTSAAGDMMHRGYSSNSSGSSRYESSAPPRTLQHQDSGFSINDAFSSALPSNIFDEDDELSHIPPPVTPTPDAIPPQHEKFYEIMLKHRARMMENPPLPPLPTDSKPPPPPPPPPTSPPPPPSL